MFQLSSQPIQPLPMEHEGAGGFVTFEGKVRDRNDGKPVVRLEYEAFGPMAEQEGNRILQEAIAAFSLLEARAVHRVGLLAIGETAVWIGVAAAHRKAAFEACEWIIDEIKKRVPIWKKEHYADGPSEWIGSQPEGDRRSQEFYRRQIRIPSIGEAGQAKLAETKVLVVGAGGLGSAALPYLAGAGFGTIGICDDETVEVSNLHRQVLFRFADCGEPKAMRAAQELGRLNPYLRIDAHVQRVHPGNAEELIAPYDIVLDGTDNFSAKFLLNETCVRLGKPLIIASLHRFDGQMLSIVPGSPGGCLRCLWQEAPFDGCVGTCAEEGVLGAVAGVFGALQAAEAVKLALGHEGVLDASMLLLDVRSYAARRLKRSARGDCPVCGSGSEGGSNIDLTITEAERERLPYVDIRERDEWEIPLGLEPVARCPASDFDQLRTACRQLGNAVLVCESGARSSILARRLRAEEIGAYSLLGGARSARKAGQSH